MFNIVEDKDVATTIVNAQRIFEEKYFFTAPIVTVLVTLHRLSSS